MTLSDLGWLSKILYDTKRRAISLRQLSFLLEGETRLLQLLWLEQLLMLVMK